MGPSSRCPQRQNYEIEADAAATGTANAPQFRGATHALRHNVCQQESCPGIKDRASGRRSMCMHRQCVSTDPEAKHPKIFRDLWVQRHVDHALHERQRTWPHGTFWGHERHGRSRRDSWPRSTCARYRTDHTNSQGDDPYDHLQLTLQATGRHDALPHHQRRQEIAIISVCGYSHRRSEPLPGHGRQEYRPQERCRAPVRVLL